MKILNIIGMGFVLASGAASAAAPAWKVESEKRVYFAPEATLKISRDELHADDDYWDRISISLSYAGEDLQRQGAQIRGENPGWEVVRLPLQKNGNYRLRIPALGVDEEVPVMLSPEGPYFNASYFVKKKDSRAVKNALANPSSFLEVQGMLTVSVPKEIVAERAELPGRVCEELRKNGADVYAAILGFPAVEAAIQSAAKREENRVALRKMVLDSCLDISGKVRVNSFSELLALPLREVSPDSNFVVEHRVMGREDQPLPLGYHISLGE